MRTTSIGRAILPIVAAAALVAGCAGGSGGGASGGPTSAPSAPAPTDNGVAALSADEILERAKTALKTANSYRFEGEVNSDGQRLGLDFKVQGNDLRGKLTMDGAGVELLAVAGQQYIRPDKAFWVKNAGAKAAENIVKLMGDKWAKVSTKDKISDLFGVANVADQLKPDGKLSKGATKQVNGVEAIGLVDDSAEGGTLYVATTGEPYPLMLEGRDPSQGRLVFSNFGSTFDDVKAPPEAQVVNFDELKTS